MVRIRTLERVLPLSIGALFLVAMLLLIPLRDADASGFGVGLHGAKATGLALAGGSWVDDATANYYNPAGLGMTEGLQFNNTALIIAPRNTYEADSGEGPSEDGEAHTLVVPSLYVSYKISEDWAVGMGLNVPFGLTVDWPNTWAGRYIIDKAELNTLFLNPNVAYRLPFSPGLADDGEEDEIWVAAGLNILVDGFLKFRRKLDFRFLGQPDASATITGRPEDLEFGWVIGALYKTKLLEREFRFGFQFRSQVNAIEIDGRARFRNLPPSVSFPASTDAVTKVTLPANWVIDLSGEVIPDTLKLHVTLAGTDWRVFDEVTFDFPETAGQPPDEELHFEWKHGIHWRVGVEWTPIEDLVLRAGWFWEEEVIPADRRDPIVPSEELNAVSIGAGYTFETPILGGETTIDLAYIVVWTVADKDNEVGGDSPGGPARANGEYTAVIHGFVLGFNFKF